MFNTSSFPVDDLRSFYDKDVAFDDPTFDIIVNGVEEVVKLYGQTNTEKWL